MNATRHNRPHAIDPSVMTTEQLALIKRMAFNHCERLDKEPTREEMKKYQKDAELLLLFYSALNNAMAETENELADANLLRQNVKKYFLTAAKLLYRNYNAVYTAIKKADPRNQKVFDYCFVQVSRKIDDCILLAPPERGYNIVMALLRIIIRFNDKLGRFIVREAVALTTVLKYMERITMIEDHHIDNIIERVVRDFNK